jgi:hypothetical protein
LIRTACAELGYWRWRLLMDSPDLVAIDPMQQTLFKTPMRGTTIDLTRPPLSRQHKQWTDPTDYSSCQQLARKARDAGVQMIRYESVRDPDQGSCTASVEQNDASFRGVQRRVISNTCICVTVEIPAGAHVKACKP